MIIRKQNFYFGADLLELLHISEDFIKAASLQSKTNVIIQLKYIISSKQNDKEH